MKTTFRKSLANTLIAMGLVATGSRVSPISAEGMATVEGESVPVLRILGTSTPDTINYSVSSEAVGQDFVYTFADGSAVAVASDPNTACSGGLEPVCFGSLSVPKEVVKVDLAGQNSTVSSSIYWQTGTVNDGAGRNYPAFLPLVSN